MFKARQMRATIEALRGSGQIRARGCHLLNADLRGASFRLPAGGILAEAQR